MTSKLLGDIRKGTIVLADRAYDADCLRNPIFEQGVWAYTPPKSSRASLICLPPCVYKQGNLVERFFYKLKYYRRIVTR